MLVATEEVQDEGRWCLRVNCTVCAAVPHNNAVHYLMELLAIPIHLLTIETQ